MNKHIKRLATMAEIMMKEKGSCAPLVEFHLENEHILTLLMPALGIPDVKEIALEHLKAIVKVTNAVSVLIVSEGWMRQGKTQEETLASKRKEVIQVTQMNRDGTGESWCAIVRRMEGSGKVYAIEPLDSLSAPTDGNYAKLFDGIVSDELVGQVKEQLKKVLDD